MKMAETEHIHKHHHEHVCTARTDGECIISLADVSAGYGGKMVLEHVNMCVHKGDFMAITGPNGGGKTTILRIILGLLKPVGGKVEYLCGGESVKSLRMGYLPQKNMIDSQFPITVEEVISSGLPKSGNGVLHRRSASEREAIEQTIALVGLEAERKHRIGQLSGGQLQRTLLGRAIISRPEVLVLDEPLSYVDKAFDERLYDILGELSPTTTIILVSHEMTVISKMASRHVIINRSVEECTAHHHFIQHECE